MEDLFHLGAKVIITNKEGKILLLRCEKERGAYWDLPGGRIQVGGTLKETAQREVEEETGITSLVGLQSLGMVLQNFRITLKNGDKVGLIYAFFSAQVDDVPVTISHEHNGYEWVTREQAIERVGYMGVIQFL